MRRTKAAARRHRAANRFRRKRQRLFRELRARYAESGIPLADFEKQYATSPRRKMLFSDLHDEIAMLRDNCGPFRVWVFGSYLSHRQNPNDFDTLVHYSPKPEEVLTWMQDRARGKKPVLPRRHPGTVQMLPVHGFTLPGRHP